MSTVVVPHPSPEAVGAEPRPGRSRLLSLDAFRGITIVGMILVNNPGTWGAIYPPLRHAAWHGWTPTDLVFPFFLFIVGVAITFAYDRRLAEGRPKAPLAAKAARRAALLFAFGLFMAAFPFFEFYQGFALRDFSTLRIPGVLQRIAVCYLAATLLFLYAKPKTEYVTAGVILVGYWLALLFVPAPGYGAGQLAPPEATLPAYVDRLIFGSHLWSAADRMWDPEGFLSTFPALVTTLLGVWTGRLLRSDRLPEQKTLLMLLAGVTLAAAGAAWGWFFPVNKQLWTSSFVVLTGGLALCTLGVCHWLTDVKGFRRWVQPFVVYGVNAITVYVLSGLLADLLGTIRLAGPDGTTVSLQSAIFRNVFAGAGSPELASLLYAVTWVVGWYFVLLWMYRKNIILKV